MQFITFSKPNYGLKLVLFSWLKLNGPKVMVEVIMVPGYMPLVWEYSMRKNDSLITLPIFHSS